MSNVLRKIKVLALSTLVVFGGLLIVNGFSFQNTWNTQYVLSRYFPKQNLIPPREIGQAHWNLTKTSLPSNTEGSSNWAGYITTPTSNNAYNSISGSWTIPNISGNQQNAVAAQWIGLGGVTSSDLLQMGTMEQIENGKPVAVVFWEQLPSVAQNVLSVPIGSTINVSISNSSSSTWKLTFTVHTPNGKTQTQTVSSVLDSSYAKGIGTSAEWISEDPSNENNQLVPLANMGTVKYQSVLVNGKPLNALGNNIQPVALLSSTGTVLIAPSALGTDGKSFTTTTANTNVTLGHELKGLGNLNHRRSSIRIHYNR